MHRGKRKLQENFSSTDGADGGGGGGGSEPGTSLYNSIPVARWVALGLCVRISCGRAPIKHTSPERVIALGWNLLYPAERHRMIDAFPVTNTGNVEQLGDGSRGGLDV